MEALERELAKLRGPQAPDLSMDELNKIAVSVVPYLWQREILIALSHYLGLIAVEPSLASCLATSPWKALCPTLCHDGTG